MIFQLTVIFLLSGHVTCLSNDPTSPLINLPRLGLIRGKIGKSFFTERRIYEFLGINYAKSPSKERRFKPPEEAKAWEGVYVATKMRQRCPQVDMAYYPSPSNDSLDVKEDIEDCLALNVFTPDLGPNRHGLPVMFYIHGGSFYLGSAYDFLPGFLLEEDIILVVPQYRLGPLGFLFLDTNEVPGNMGVLDILLALRWVRKYIKYFGGDPSKITVVGQSAGAVAASSFLISPIVEKDLFDKMIIQSGSVLGGWSVDGDPIKSAKSIAKILDCRTDDLDEMTACLKAVSPLDMVKAHAKYISEDIMAGGRGFGGSSLVVQGQGPQKLLEKHPREYFEEGPRISVPVMGGTTRDEGASFLANFYEVRQLKNIADERYFQRNVTRDLLKFFGFEDTNGYLIDAYQYSLFGNLVRRRKDAYPGLIDLSGVILLKQCTYDVLRIMSHSGKTFIYSFDFFGGVSKLRASEPTWDKDYPFPPGVAHSDELGYLFPATSYNYTKRELAMVRTMTKFWTNFVKHGTPDDASAWPPMSTAYGPYLRITDLPLVRESILEAFTIASREGYVTASGPSSHIPVVDVLCMAAICLMVIH